MKLMLSGVPGLHCAHPLVRSTLHGKTSGPHGAHGATQLDGGPGGPTRLRDLKMLSGPYLPKEFRAYSIIISC